MERWLPVPGYQGAYEVSDRGRVQSVRRRNARGRLCGGRVLQARSAASGHLTVALYLNANRRDFQVHHLVLWAFVGPRPAGMEGCHGNDDAADNRLENLRWDTRSANVFDSVRNGGHAMANRTHCPDGHVYTPENTYVYPTGSRACRSCRSIQRLARRAAAKNRPTTTREVA